MSNRSQKAREDVLQFILLNHPVDCGICDKAGECKLQDYQHKYGPAESISRDAKHHKRKLHDLGPRITLDNERCILCSRCVRFTREISGSNALGIIERGTHSYVEATTPGEFDDAYSDNVIDLCPTGALLSREFLYQCRVWFLQPVRSVCTGCERGCSVKSWRRSSVRQQHMPGAAARQRGLPHDRLRERRDQRPLALQQGLRPAQVDGACARAAAAGRRPGGLPWVPRSTEAKRLLAAAQHPAVLVSSHASNEELDVLKSLLGSVPTYVHRDWLPVAGEVVEDALLIKADKNPNRAASRNVSAASSSTRRRARPRAGLGRSYRSRSPSARRPGFT